MRYTIALVFDPFGYQAQKRQICGGIPPYGTALLIEPSEPHREVAIALSRFCAVSPFGTQSSCENTRIPKHSIKIDSDCVRPVATSLPINLQVVYGISHTWFNEFIGRVDGTVGFGHQQTSTQAEQSYTTG